MTADQNNIRKHPEESADHVDIRTVLRERAHLLARETVRGVSSLETIEFVEFKLADERYGIESRFIREVLVLKEFTPVSRSKAWPNSRNSRRCRPVPF